MDSTLLAEGTRADGDDGALVANLVGDGRSLLALFAVGLGLAGVRQPNGGLPRD